MTAVPTAAANENEGVAAYPAGGGLSVEERARAAKRRLKVRSPRRARLRSLPHARQRPVRVTTQFPAQPQRDGQRRHGLQTRRFREPRLTRRRLEITRALVTNPSLILLDEPFSGVDPLAVYEVQEIIKELREKGLGVLITDHNVRETLAVVDRAYLMCEGKVLREGASSFLVNDEVSRELYLGPRFSM